MAINLTTRFSGKVDEVITNGALSTPSVNKDYDFIGAKSVKVYSFGTVPLNDYSRTGTNRYGTPQELQDTVQEMTMTQDKSFSFTIDKGNKVDTEPGVREAGKQLRRETDLEIIPMLDRYRFTVIANNAKNKFYATTAITTSTAYTAFSLKLLGALIKSTSTSSGIIPCSKYSSALKAIKPPTKVVIIIQ